MRTISSTALTATTLAFFAGASLTGAGPLWAAELSAPS